MKNFFCVILFVLSTLNILSQSSLAFCENKGQVSDQNYNPCTDVLFSGNDKGLVFHLKKDGISYQLSKIVDDNKSCNNVTDLRKQFNDAKNTTIHRVDMNWLNINTNYSLQKGEALPGHNNYYLSVCPDGIAKVKSFKDVTYRNIYHGIDLRYYSNEGHLEYDFIIKPNYDYKQIQIKINGAEKLHINSKGELIITTSLGEIIEQAPVVIQNKKSLPAKWMIKDDVVSFEIENVNPAVPLIIDPMVRIWGTYYGDGDTRGYACSVDTISGNVYLAGQTSLGTNSLIATAGSYQTTIGGNYDAILVQFDPNGVRQWATFYGGLYGESSSGCVTDSSGNVYMLGTTTSSNAISSPGAHQTMIGGNYDAFLVKFNSFGVRQWATYYGSNGTEWGNNCALDASGNIYVAGESTSSFAIATVGSHQATNGGGNEAFLVKFNSNGVRQWGTYYGGNGADRGIGVAVDASGDIYMNGQTSTTLTSVISTPGSHQTNNNGSDDAFLVKFNSNGVRQWGTFYGGLNSDCGNGCSVDLFGNIYMVGYTLGGGASGIFNTPGCHQPNSGGGPNEIFVVKFNSTGVRQWGTYYGGPGTDYSGSCGNDRSGNVFLVGTTNNSYGTTIATPGSHQPVSGGGQNAFLAKFNSAGTRQWGTYYGDAAEYGFECATDLSGNIYLVGQTSSTTAIATTGSHQDTLGGISDAFLVKFNDGGQSLSVSENDQFIDNIKVYPNPASDFITIETKNADQVTIEIIDAIGKVLMHEVKTKTGLYNIPIGHLCEGIYFAKIISGDQISKPVKIVKE